MLFLLTHKLRGENSHWTISRVGGHLPCAQRFLYLVSFPPLYHFPPSGVDPTFPSCRWEDWTSQRSGNLPKVTQLGDGLAPLSTSGLEAQALSWALCWPWPPSLTRTLCRPSWREIFVQFSSWQKMTSSSDQIVAFHLTWAVAQPLGLNGVKRQGPCHRSHHFLLNSQNQRQPHTPKGSTLGLLLHCHHLKIVNNCSTKSLHFHFALSPEN